MYREFYTTSVYLAVLFRSRLGQPLAKHGGVYIGIEVSSVSHYSIIPGLGGATGPWGCGLVDQ